MATLTLTLSLSLTLPLTLALTLALPMSPQELKMAISPLSPLYLPYISPISPYISLQDERARILQLRAERAEAALVEQAREILGDRGEMSGRCKGYVGEV